MHLLSNLKVGQKIYLILGLLSIVAISIGILGLIGISNADSSLQTVYEDRVIPLKQLKTVSDMYAVNIVDTCHKVRNGNLTWTEGIKNLDDATSAIKKEWNAYISTKLVEKEEKLVKEATPLFSKADSSIARVKEIMQKQEKDALTNYTINELYPNIDPISGKICELIDLQLEVANQEYVAAQKDYNTFRMVFISILAIGIGLGIVISLIIRRTITQQLDTMISSIHKDEQGYISVKEFVVTSNDEIGLLGTTLNTFIAQIREFIGHVGSSAESVSASSQQLTAGAEQSAHASSQVAATITTVAQGMERQLKSLNTTSDTIQAISSSIQQIAASSTSMSDTSTKAANAAEEGSRAISTAIKQMNIIETTVLSSAEVVTRLGESSKEIGQIVDSISAIAGQTNLLALNAAIEAARAGEQGRGFAVVAEEVRKLAEQSAKSAEQIAQLISEIQWETDKAVKAMNSGTHEVKIGSEVVTSAGDAFKQIYSLITEVSIQVNETSASVQQVAEGSKEIVKSIRDIDSVSKETASQTQTVSAATEEQAASSQEIAASSQALSKMAGELQNAVKQFAI